jgi:hypothetical protein
VVATAEASGGTSASAWQQFEPCGTALCDGGSGGGGGGGLFSACNATAWGAWGACGVTCGGGAAAVRRRTRALHSTSRNASWPRGSLRLGSPTATLGLCEGDCLNFDHNGQCGDGYICHRSGGTAAPVPGCDGVPASGAGYCVLPDALAPCADADVPPLEEKKACGGDACPEACAVSQWGLWTPCDRSCRHSSGALADGGVELRGGEHDGRLSGWRRRSRAVLRRAAAGGAPCPALVEYEAGCAAAVPCPIDCAYSLWGAWEGCSSGSGTGALACGTAGTQTRLRSASVDAAFGGKACGEGGVAETRSCLTPCAITAAAAITAALALDGGAGCVVTMWGEWGECDATCGGGRRGRSRQLHAASADAAAVTAAAATQTFRVCPALGEAAACQTHACPLSCVVGPWGGWGACGGAGASPLLCGGAGTQARKRGVLRPPVAGGMGCSPRAQQRACEAPPCAADECLVTAWGAWPPCDSSCGPGTQVSHTRASHASARVACFRARRMRSHVHASSSPLPSNPASLPSPRNARSLGPRAPRARWHLGRVPPAHRAARVRGHGVCRALHRVRLVLLDRVPRQLHPGGCRAGQQQQQQQQQQRRGFAWRRARLLADARALHRDGRGARGRGVPAAAGEEGLRADPVP